MRHAFISIGICIFTAACSGQPFSPTSPSGVAGVSPRTQASGGDPVEVTFTKWITAFPAMAGVTGGDVPGTFAGAILSREPFDNGTIVQLEARYEVTGADPAHSFVAHIEGKTNNPTQKAVLNGTVIAGWLVGAQVHVTFDVIVPATGTSCVPAAPVNRTCFQGTIRILPGSAN
jgi:hypothetical protein